MIGVKWLFSAYDIDSGIVRANEVAIVGYHL